MASPTKVVPLNDFPRTRSDSSLTSSAITKRAFYCSVVFEGGTNGKVLPQDVQDIIASLGTQLTADGQPITEDRLTDIRATTSTEMLLDEPSSDPIRRKRALTDASTFADILNELITTERSYVRRINILKQSYADPLRSFARQKDTAIIPAYEAKTLFGNIDALVPANEAFLIDLERMIGPNGQNLVGGIGDVALKHFKELKTFDCYKQYYSKREEAQTIFEREMMKKSSTGFAGFIDRIKYSTAETRNRVGLRELLMDPVQRVPRYTLLFRSMIKHMPLSDPQRAKLIEADEAASKIAQCETDEQTKRAAVMYCLERTVDGFPPGLISNGRKFIDCIDVDDLPIEGINLMPSSSSSTAPVPLPCSLFLFDDRLMIVKRHNPSTSGRAMAGLDEIDKVAKSGILSATLGMKKGGMSFKGLVDITDVVATDVGGAELHLFLEQEPQDQSERWSNRPFRSYSVVNPPSPPALNPVQLGADKTRFLENLWLAQALYRAKQGRSVPFVSEDKEVGSKGSHGRRRTIARTYFNVYQRMAYLGEPKKGKIILHIDSTGEADPLPFGVDCGPYIIVRVQPMAGAWCRYAVSSNDPSVDDQDDDDRDNIVQTSTVSSRIVDTIHRSGLFKFRTGNISQPSTPTPSTRGRAAIFNLDAISRNLFNSRPASSKGISNTSFGSVSNRSGGHKRTRSTTSRSTASTSQMTGSTTNDSSMKTSHRSNSTAATSLMDEESFGARSRDSPKKLHRKRAPEDPGSFSDSPRSRETSRERVEVLYDTDGDVGKPRASAVDESEWDLSMRLELARKNSQTQAVSESMEDFYHRERHSEEAGVDAEDNASTLRVASVYEAERPVSPASTFRPRSNTPTQLGLDIPRPTSAMSSRRPMGPRSPGLSPGLFPMDIPSSATLVRTPSMEPPRTPSPTPTPRRRLPLEPVSTPVTNAPPSTPSATRGPDAPPGTVEPLSIRKKTSVSVRHTSPTSTRKSRGSPVSRTPTRDSTQSRRTKDSRPVPSGSKLSKLGLAERAMTVAEATLEDVNSSRRAVKRIKLEVDAMRSKDFDSKDKPRRLNAAVNPMPRSPHTRHLANKAVEARFEEMRALIEKGRGGTIHRSDSVLQASSSSSSLSDSPDLGNWINTVEGLVSDADRDLKRARTNHEMLQTDLNQLATEYHQKTSELDKVNSELQHSKRQCELVKKLLADATAENEIMYDAFNEELDNMFQDANLPGDEAWKAMTTDLRNTKEARNTLSKENSSLKRNLEMAQLQNEEWGALLRSHGLL